MAKWIGCWTQDQKVWDSIQSSGHILYKCWTNFIFHITLADLIEIIYLFIIHNLHSPNEYTVHRFKAGSMVTFCMSDQVARRKVKSEEHT